MGNRRRLGFIRIEARTGGQVLEPWIWNIYWILTRLKKREREIRDAKSKNKTLLHWILAYFQRESRRFVLKMKINEDDTLDSSVLIKESRERKTFDDG